MKDHGRVLARQYAATLERFIANPHEAILAESYELGRAAIAAGLGVLDMTRFHQRALSALRRKGGRAELDAPTQSAVDLFLCEALSPFEVIHRGFRETSVRLQQLIATLEERNNELEAEIDEHKRTEQALLASEEHFRRLFKEAEAMQERLRELSKRILNLQEEEWKRISRELHDEVGQSMTAISMKLEMLKHEDVRGADFGRNLAATQAQLAATMETVHRFARELRPAMLDELGLLPALRSYLNAFADRTGVQVRFQASARAEQLDDEQKTVVYRIAQECLTNVAKHAQASQVRVKISKCKDNLRMEVADNGKSFSGDAVGSSKGKNRLGLLGLQERVLLVNGHFDIRPKAGRGTTVRVLIPFRKATVSDSLKKHRKDRKCSSPSHAPRAGLESCQPTQTFS